MKAQVNNAVTSLIYSINTITQLAYLSSSLKSIAKERDTTYTERVCVCVFFLNTDGDFMNTLDSPDRRNTNSM